MSYDLVGQKFGYLTVVEKAGSDPQRAEWRWLCKCECGNLTIVPSYRLRHGGVTSCGCHKYDRNFCSKKAKNHPRLYRIYQNMKTRCYNPKAEQYKWYGAKGIKICDEWLEFDNFCDWALSNGYDESAKFAQCTIDRIDHTADYSPQNCRWANATIQANNTSRNRRVTANGKTQTLAEWSREIGINQGTLQHRLSIGWSEEECINIPVLGKGEHYYRKTHRV